MPNGAKFTKMSAVWAKKTYDKRLISLPFCQIFRRFLAFCPALFDFFYRLS